MIDINPDSQEERLLDLELKYLKVIRCMSCGFWHEGLSINDGYCGLHHIYMGGHDGCSRGEPKRR